jgi:hypothetical protein
MSYVLHFYEPGYLSLECCCQIEVLLLVDLELGFLVDFSNARNVWQNSKSLVL